MQALYRYFRLFLVMLLPIAPAVAQVITIDTSAMRNRFVPEQTLGAGLDRISTEAVEKTLNKELLDQLAPSGWGPITYRNNTELAVEAWHWNAEGAWSEKGEKGYFVGASRLGPEIRNSFGYTLPRRGFTRNDGTGNTGFSRLTDGDSTTFWKSNPYLAERYTGELDSAHPQWIVIDLKRKEMVDSIRLEWAAPFASKYQIQYWTGEDPIGQPNHGVWQMLPAGEITAGHGGVETVRFSKLLVQLQFLRVMMIESSGTCVGDDASDERNCVGYAVREVGVGTTSMDGTFHDLLRHTPDQDQSTTYCSSVDPWHAATNLESTRQSQPGLDLFFRSGITHNLPAMIPVSIIYSVPEDAVAQIHYLQQRHYPISYIELGEEADGQYMSPEDYGALYLQFAKALHGFDPTLKLGGPAFQGQPMTYLHGPMLQGVPLGLRGSSLTWQRTSELRTLRFFPLSITPCRAATLNGPAFMTNRSR